MIIENKSISEIITMNNQDFEHIFAGMTKKASLTGEFPVNYYRNCLQAML